MGKKNEKIVFNLFDVEEVLNTEGFDESVNEAVPEPESKKNQFSFFDATNENQDDNISDNETFDNAVKFESKSDKTDDIIQPNAKVSENTDKKENNEKIILHGEDTVKEEKAEVKNSNSENAAQKDENEIHSDESANYTENLFDIAQKQTEKVTLNAAEETFSPQIITFEINNNDDSSPKESNQNENDDNEKNFNLDRKEIEKSDNNEKTDTNGNVIIDFENISEKNKVAENAIEEENTEESEENFKEENDEIIATKDGEDGENAGKNFKPSIPSFEINITPEASVEEVVTASKKGFRSLFKRNKKKNTFKNTTQEEESESNFEISDVINETTDSEVASTAKTTEEITPDDVDSLESNCDNDNTADENSSDENNEKPTFADSTLKETLDADAMVSMLEEDVSAELIGGQDEIDFTEFNTEKVKEEPKKTTEYKKFEDIKNISVMDAFETPYVYCGKKGEHIRYRLSLPTDKNPKKLRMKYEIMDYFLLFVTALIIALLLRQYVCVFATVDGPSMEPTLYSNERIFVARYAYYFSEIERGDIVVCDFPNELYKDHYVKRVIALGGETVRITNGTVYVDDKAMTEDYIKEAPLNDMDPVYVPEGYVFVMGDNRNNSTDSRKSYIGPISKKLIIGKAKAVLYPFSKISTLE